MRQFVALAVLVFLFSSIPLPSAQLLNKQAPVIVGHYH
jgi:hypothetical protein